MNKILVWTKEHRRIKWILLIILLSFSVAPIIAGENSEVNDNKTLYEMAKQAHLESDNDLALKYLNQAIETTDAENYKTVADIYILRSTIYGKLTLFENAMEDAIYALNICEKHQITDTKAKALLSIANIHYLMYNDDKAEEFILKAKTLAEKNGYNNEIMQAYGKLGELYKATGRTKEALPLLMKSLEMGKNLSDTLHIITYLRVLGDYYITLNRRISPNTEPIVEEYQIKAKKYLDEAMSLALKKNVPAYINQINMCFIRWSRVDENFTKALEYAQKVIENCATNDYSLLIQVYDHLVTIYAVLEDPENSVESHRIFYNMMLKQNDEKLHRALQEMEVKYDVQQKELEILHHQLEIKRHKTLRYFYVGGLLVAAVLITLLFLVVRLSRKRNRELSEINATKDKFFSIISHDLKNPTIAQRDAISMLIDFKNEWDEERLSKFYNELLKSADSQVELLYNLLNWTHVHTGRMLYQPVEFNLITALQYDLSLIKSMASRKEILIETHIPETAMVMGDDRMILTVVRNLLNNAVKFTEKGGIVTLNITPCTDRVRSIPTYTISISDTGIGIAPEQMKNLFSIDKRCSQTGTTGEQGSGLGLIVCKELLEKHGSQLYIDTEERKGSRFWFEI
ncbi:MAG: tetratricopeptide repeat-containing sensor histidine kinase [Lentimicrobiaceae bacterium]|nr:tetratricopeptide repeat-containing sensor histidine kinase [Lentimicrobiaceae bacterium]